MSDTVFRYANHFIRGWNVRRKNDWTLNIYPDRPRGAQVRIWIYQKRPIVFWVNHPQFRGNFLRLQDGGKRIKAIGRRLDMILRIAKLGRLLLDPAWIYIPDNDPLERRWRGQMDFWYNHSRLPALLPPPITDRIKTLYGFPEY